MRKPRALIGAAVVVLAALAAWLVGTRVGGDAADPKPPIIEWFSAPTLYPAIDGVPSGEYGIGCGFAFNFLASHATVPPERLLFEVDWASSFDVKGELPALRTSSYVNEGKLTIGVSGTFAHGQLRDTSTVTLRLRVKAPLGSEMVVADSLMPLNTKL
ncbi:MAG: hypothetical protein U1E39_14555 [Planctomycetota bacterium]